MIEQRKDEKTRRRGYRELEEKHEDLHNMR